MTTRDLLGTKLLIKSPPNKAFNLDTILVADFVRVIKNTKLIYDFGSGNGAIMLYLSQKTNAKILGVEVQEHRHELALSNIKLNKLEHRLNSLNEDLNTFKAKLKADIIVSNPPYYKVSLQSKKSVDKDFLIAKHEIKLDLDNLIKAVKNNIKHGGLFIFIHQANRLEEIIITLKKYDFSIKRLRLVYPFINAKPNQVLIEAKYKGGSFLNIMPPLIQYQEKDILSNEMKEIYEGRSYHD